MPRYIAITDIHGELNKLESVLSQIETKPDDIFVFMGDYIDRGPDSKGVVDRIIKQSETHRCIYLIGSHEYALLHAPSDDYYQYLFDNYGGPATIRSYGSFENIFRIHGEFFKSLKFYYLTDKYLFVHAGINLYIQNTNCRKKLFSDILSLTNRISTMTKSVLTSDAGNIRMLTFVH